MRSGKQDNFIKEKLFNLLVFPFIINLNYIDFAFPGRSGSTLAGWMDAQGREISIWQQMIERQNFWVEASIPIRQLTHQHNSMEK